MDDNVLKFLYDDNQRVEPEWYIPIIPMVLINGAEGIGTGWSCKIPNFDIRETVNNIRRLMDGEEPLPMVTCFNYVLLIQHILKHLMLLFLRTCKDTKLNPAFFSA